MSFAPRHTAVYLVEVTKASASTSQSAGSPPRVSRQLYRALYATPGFKGGFAVRTFEVLSIDGASPVSEDEEVCDFPTLAAAREYCDRVAGFIAERRRRTRAEP